MAGAPMEARPDTRSCTVRPNEQRPTDQGSVLVTEDDAGITGFQPYFPANVFCSPMHILSNARIREQGLSQAHPSHASTLAGRDAEASLQRGEVEKEKVPSVVAPHLGVDLSLLHGGEGLLVEQAAEVGEAPVKGKCPPLIARRRSFVALVDSEWNSGLRRGGLDEDTEVGELKGWSAYICQAMSQCESDYSCAKNNDIALGIFGGNARRVGGVGSAWFVHCYCGLIEQAREVRLEDGESGDQSMRHVNRLCWVGARPMVIVSLAGLNSG